MTEVYIMRHGECQKDMGAKPGPFGDLSFSWPLTETGKEQVAAAREYFLSQGLIDPKQDPASIANDLEHKCLDTAIIGSQLRMRESFVELDPGIPFFHEDYLNGRPRRKGGNLSDSVENLRRHSLGAAERLMTRIKGSCNEFSKVLVVTAREIMTLIQFRLRGTPIGQKHEILENLAHGGKQPASDIDYYPGEILALTDINPGTNERERNFSFRWQKRINPLLEARNQDDWQEARVRTFTKEEALDPKLWGDT